MLGWDGSVVPKEAVAAGGRDAPKSSKRSTETTPLLQPSAVHPGSGSGGDVKDVSISVVGPPRNTSSPVYRRTKPGAASVSSASSSTATLSNSDSNLPSDPDAKARGGVS